MILVYFSPISIFPSDLAMIESDKIELFHPNRKKAAFITSGYHFQNNYNRCFTYL